LEIPVLHRQGKGIREIVRDTGVSRNTVRRYLRDEEATRYSRVHRGWRSSIRSKPMSSNGCGLRPPERIPASVLLMEYANAAIPAATRC
jgi:transposase